ncbi:MAG: translocation protein TolB [Planctomycetaceae bacterium]|nr:translocation protein TolB [Planctomycetaceae bacterium]
MRFAALSILTIFTFAQSLSAAEPAPDYDQHVAPILKKYCAGCHNPTELDGEFSLESFSDLQKGGSHGAAILAGDSKSSRLIRVLTGQAKPAMPPKDNPAPSVAEIALLKAWIDAGAVGPKGSVPTIPQLVVPKITAAKQSQRITSVAWSPDGKLLAVAQSGKVELRHPDSLQVIGEIGGQPGKITSVKFSADGKLLLIASGVTGLYGQATLWNIAENKAAQVLKGHRDLLYAAVLTRDGKILATGSYDRQIILWNAETGEQVRTLKGHNDAIYDLAFNPAGTVLASASGDQTVKLWQVSTGIRLDTLSQPLKEQYCVTFSPDGQFVVAGGVDNRIRVWKLMSDSVPQINPILYSRFAHEGPLVQLAFSNDGKQLASVSEDRTVKLWDTMQFNETFAYDKFEDVVMAFAWSPSNDKFVVGLNGTLTMLPVKSVANVHAKVVLSNSAGQSLDAPMHQIAEQEGNNTPADAKLIPLPATITGAIHATGSNERSDPDLYRFEAKAGQQWVFEIKASRDKSSLDSKLEILDGNGKPIIRKLMQAVRDSYITFRGIDSNTRDCRVHNWEEMKLNEYLFMGGEVVKLYLAPRGPDSGFGFYPHDGSRRGYFDTTPMSHAVNEPCYSVVPVEPGDVIVPNGLPVFPLYYENDDDGLRQWGSDSRLNFTAPADGQYLVRVTDVRGFHGENFKYTLTVRPSRPGFEVTLNGAAPSINLGSGKEFSVTANRLDEFDGEIRVDIKNLPAGFGVTTPLIIPAGHNIARGTLNSLLSAKAPTAEQSKAIEVSATALVNDQAVTKPVNNFGEIKLADKPKIFVQVLPMETPAAPTTPDPNAIPTPYEITIQPGQTMTARVRIERNGYEGRVQFEAINQNLPHGVIIDNVGLNGLMIVEGTNERVFFLTAANWVPDQTRTFHLKSQEEGNQTSWPVIFHVKKRP